MTTTARIHWDANAGADAGWYCEVCDAEGQIFGNSQNVGTPDGPRRHDAGERSLVRWGRAVARACGAEGLVEVEIR